MENEEIANEVNSVVSQIEEDEDEIERKQRKLEKRNELFAEWEFPQITGRIQNYDNIIVEFINVNRFLNDFFHRFTNSLSFIFWN